MNFQFYVEKLQHLDDFNEFMKKNPDSYCCSGFFVIGLEEKKDNKIFEDKQHFDFWLPKDKKIMSFQLEESKFVEVEVFDENVPSEVNLYLSFDFDKIKELILEKMLERGIKNKLQKILLSLQEKNGNHYLMGTAFISMLGILKINIDLDNMKITDFEKKSFFDIMKVRRKEK